MYKKYFAYKRGMPYGNLPKFFLAMKLLSVLIFLGAFQLNAAVHAQYINIDVKNTSLKEVFSMLTRQSNYEFMYDSQTLQNARPVTLKVVNATLKEVLNKCFANQAITYQIKENTIIVAKADDQPQVWMQVNGIVLSGEDGLPLPGVIVRVKGTNKSIVTNNSGQFTINAEIGDVLVLSFIGYKTQEIVIKDDVALKVRLISSPTDLDNVIVTGYGTTQKSDVISSLGVIKGEDLQKAPVKSFEEALAGRVSGVQVTSSEGGPGATTNIVIRGNNSLSQDNSPLWVIDGFPIENPNNNTINPADVETITVLKDAASTAIYGSRGANGVILVTTKTGKSGNPVVSFDGSYGFQRSLKLMELLKPYEYVQLVIERNGVVAKERYTPGDPELDGRPAYVPGGRTIDYYKTQPYTNWQDKLFQTAPFQNYSLSLSGGTDKSKYLISGSTTDQDGTILQTNFKRYQGRFVFSQEVNKKTDFNLNVNYARTRTTGTSPSNIPTNGSASLSLLYGIWGYRPAVSPSSSVEDQLNLPIDPDGQNAYSFNPIVQNNNTTINAHLNNLVANAGIDYKILPELTFRVTGGINYTQRLSNAFYSALTYQGGPGSVLGPNGFIDNYALTNLVNENTLNYKKVFNTEHTLNLLGGFSIQGTKLTTSRALASKVPNDVLGVSGLDEGTPYAISSGSTQNFLSSYFSRINYNYKSKYYFSGVIRADGSSKFAPGNQWGYFPSAAVSWNIGREDFMKNISSVSALKFRASYGTSGNNRIADYAYLSPINQSDISSTYTFGNTYIKGSYQSGLANEALKWETTAITDLGLDFGFLKNRIELTVDYYRKITSDLLLQATIPGHIGYTSAIQNIGSVRNSGWEFSLNTVNSDKALKWSSNFNISFNRNEVLALSSGQRGLISQVSYNINPAFPYVAIVGGPISQIIGFKWLGNYQYEDFDLLPNGAYVLKGNLPANGSARTAMQPGDIKYEDINQDGTITDADKVVIGNPNPLFTGGFSNNFNFKNFDLSILLTFSYGNDILNANRLIFEGMPDSYTNQFASYANRWTPENQTNLYPRAGGATTIPAVSSRVIEDGSFLRLQTVSLGYNLPQKISESLKVKNARIYASAQNLAVWSKYQGSDPEVSTRPGALTQGFDYAAYPRSFTMTFGLNFSF
ncbi:TonB-dependent receptor plug [Pedobacter heparinus DSM 2366]|uniref:TonB-dependent receptor plug n=2 Tax=Pedobacter heparinus TaxID=984 RepID=C6Y2W5_PEDHD|nr:TonB-dependent receptor plug [Pedobacter heparinus DSM 2366]